MHRLILLLSLVSTITACTPSVNSEAIPAPPAHLGLFSPVQLGPDSTRVIVADYFPAGEWPDSIATHTMLKFQADSLKGHILLTAPKPSELPWLSCLDLNFGPHSYSILLKRSRKNRATFFFDPRGNTYQSVAIAGAFNDWNPDQGALKYKDGSWQGDFVLDPGAYQYQIVVDGAWMLDPGNPETVANNLGGFNSLKRVGNSQRDMLSAETRLLPYAADSQNIRLQFVVDLTSGIDERKTPQECFAFWENHRLAATPGDGEAYNFRWTIPIPDTARNLQRSHIRAWIRSASGYYNDILIPLEYGKVVRSPAQLNFADQHQNVLYFPLIDRFCDGDSSNNAPLDDFRVHPKANYHGGDLAGVLTQLKAGWFDSLGINTLWLSPIVRNPDSAFQEYPAPRRWFSGYHGYWPVASTQVDPRLGTPDLLKVLIAEAHARDIKVLLDFVANHVHEENPMIAAHPDWATPLYLEDSTPNIRIWEAQRLTTWLDPFLPSLDFSNPEVIEAQVDTVLYWLNNYDIDGFRYDATKHIPPTFWRRLNQKIKTEFILPRKQPLFQIGESIANRELIGESVGTGLLDGQFDFNLYFDTRRVFSAQQPQVADLVRTVMQSLTAYGHHSLMGNFAGNQDMPRFISLAGGDLQPGEDAVVAGWSREVGVGDTLGYRRLSLYTAFLTALPGVPVLYYGDEIGMPGAGDPDNRRDMRFSGFNSHEQQVLTNCRKLIHLRRSHMATLYGETEFAEKGPTGLVIIRSYFGESVIYALNLSDHPTNFQLGSTSGKRFGMMETNFGAQWDQEARGYGELEVGPWSFEVLTPVKPAK